MVPGAAVLPAPGVPVPACGVCSLKQQPHCGLEAQPKELALNSGSEKPGKDFTRIILLASPFS